MQNVQHVGIDISKDTFNAAFKDSEGRWRESSFVNKAKGFRELLSWVGSTAKFTMEATGYYHLETALFLHGKGQTVHVSNPMLVKRFSQMRFQRAKTDRADARMISEYSVVNATELRIWKPATTEMAKARTIITAIKQLDKQNAQTMSCIHALKLTTAGRATATRLVPLLKAQRTLRRDLEKSVEELVKDSFDEEYKCALTIPGVGEKTASSIIVCTNGLKDFTTSKQIVAYVGLSPRVFESGSSVRGRGHICKLGSGYLRKLLYMCAVSSLRCNKPCRLFYDKLVASGKPKKVAMVAVANKLLRTIFSLIKAKCAWSLEVALAH